MLRSTARAIKYRNRIHLLLLRRFTSNPSEPSGPKKESVAESLAKNSSPSRLATNNSKYHHEAIPADLNLFSNTPEITTELAILVKDSLELESEYRSVVLASPHPGSSHMLQKMVDFVAEKLNADVFTKLLIYRLFLWITLQYY